MSRVCFLFVCLFSQPSPPSTLGPNPLLLCPCVLYTCSLKALHLSPLSLPHFLWLLSVSSLLQCYWLYFACLFCWLGSISYRNMKLFCFFQVLFHIKAEWKWVLKFQVLQILNGRTGMTWLEEIKYLIPKGNTNSCSSFPLLTFLNLLIRSPSPMSIVHCATLKITLLLANHNKERVKIVQEEENACLRKLIYD